jgi:hypothetical protein
MGDDPKDLRLEPVDRVMLAGLLSQPQLGDPALGLGARVHRQHLRAELLGLVFGKPEPGGDRSGGALRQSLLAAQDLTESGGRNTEIPRERAKRVARVRLAALLQGADQEPSVIGLGFHKALEQ